MRKIHEILRLHFEQKLGQRQIARSANVSQSTVHEYLARMNAAGLRWPLNEEWDEDRCSRRAKRRRKCRCGYSPILSTSANSLSSTAI